MYVWWLPFRQQLGVEARNGRRYWVAEDFGDTRTAPAGRRDCRDDGQDPAPEKPRNESRCADGASIDTRWDDHASGAAGRGAVARKRLPEVVGERALFCRVELVREVGRTEVEPQVVLNPVVVKDGPA